MGRIKWESKVWAFWVAQLDSSKSRLPLHTHSLVLYELFPRSFFGFGSTRSRADTINKGSIFNMSEFKMRVFFPIG
jgi:hypothetical protein